MELIYIIIFICSHNRWITFGIFIPNAKNDVIYVLGKLIKAPTKLQL